MEFVQPIRDMNKIKEMKNHLKDGRDRFLFVLGINIGLRISDLLSLKVSDIKGSHIIIREQKTNKINRLKINETLRKEIEEYIAGKKDDDCLFPSRNGVNKPISRVQAWMILNAAANAIGLSEIGTHTLRKTFGYHFYRKTKDIVLLQNIFNHSNPGVTLRYIGINQDIADNAIEDFTL